MQNQDLGTVTCVVPSDVNLTLPGFRVIKFKAGVQEIPTEYANHPFMRANGVKVYTGSTPPRNLVPSPVATEQHAEFIGLLGFYNGKPTLDQAQLYINSLNPQALNRFHGEYLEYQRGVTNAAAIKAAADAKAATDHLVAQGLTNVAAAAVVKEHGPAKVLADKAAADTQAAYDKANAAGIHLAAAPAAPPAGATGPADPKAQGAADPKAQGAADAAQDKADTAQAAADASPASAKLQTAADTAQNKADDKQDDADAEEAAAEKEEADAAALAQKATTEAEKADAAAAKSKADAAIAAARARARKPGNGKK